MKSIYRLKGRGPRTGLEENQGEQCLEKNAAERLREMMTEHTDLVMETGGSLVTFARTVSIL